MPKLPSSIIRRGVTRLQGSQTVAELRGAGLRCGQNLAIGKRTYIDKPFAWAITIGNDTTLSWGVSVIAHDAAGRRHLEYTEVQPVSIGSRVYVGAGAIVLPGSTIGDDAIIGAGSVVRGTIPAGVVAAGNPCRVLGSVDDYVARKRPLLDSFPVFAFNRRSMTSADIATAQLQLDEHSRIFLK